MHTHAAAVATALLLTVDAASAITPTPLRELAARNGIFFGAAANYGEVCLAMSCHVMS